MCVAHFLYVPYCGDMCPDMNWPALSTHISICLSLWAGEKSSPHVHSVCVLTSLLQKCLNAVDGQKHNWMKVRLSQSKKYGLLWIVRKRLNKQNIFWIQSFGEYIIFCTIITWINDFNADDLNWIFTWSVWERSYLECRNTLTYFYLGYFVGWGCWG